MAKKVFTVGDLVFAKVKGYPAWPARVTGRTTGGKYCVFFFGTFEVGNMKPEEMWPYNKKFLDRFGPQNMKKKWYSEGLYQIEHSPEIAFQEVAVEGGGDVQGGGDVDDNQISHTENIDPEPVLVKVLSSNQVTEISVNQEQSDGSIHEEFTNTKIKCKFGIAEAILKDKDSIMDDEVKQQLREKVEMVKMETKENILLRKIEKLKWLQSEQKLVVVVCQIQKSMSGGSHNMVKCVEMLTLMEEMEIKPLMVIKMPEVFMTVRRLSTDWIPGGEGSLTEEVREKSEMIRERIIIEFMGAPTALEQFNDILEDKVNEFKKKTSDMSGRERMGIVDLNDL